MLTSSWMWWGLLSHCIGHLLSLSRGIYSIEQIPGNDEIIHEFLTNAIRNLKKSKENITVNGRVSVYIKIVERVDWKRNMLLPYLVME